MQGRPQVDGLVPVVMNSSVSTPHGSRPASWIGGFNRQNRVPADPGENNLLYPDDAVLITPVSAVVGVSGGRGPRY